MTEMRLESMKPTTDRESLIRRQTHAKAIISGLTMRDAVYKALELWIQEEHHDDTTKGH